jgi:hypothetical protein
VRGKDPRTRRASDRMRPNTISAVILHGRLFKV